MIIYCEVGKGDGAMRRKRKPIPAFRDEAEERKFWEANDSAEYIDWRKAKRVSFSNLKPSMAAGSRASKLKAT